MIKLDYIKFFVVDNLILLVNNTNQRLYKTILLNQIKEIVKTVLENNGFYYYLIHNHPSEYNYPSPLDIKMTSSLLSLSEKIGIKLIDHIIISRSGYLSILKNIE